jgi:hypothetical protein
MNEYGYGYHIWRSVRKDSYQFNGMFGQNLFIFPDIRLVIGIYSGNTEFFPKGQMGALVQKYFGNHYKLSVNELKPSRRAYGTLSSFAVSLALPKPQSRQEKMKKYTSLMPVVNKSFISSVKMQACYPFHFLCFMQISRAALKKYPSA